MLSLTMQKQINRFPFIGFPKENKENAFVNDAY